MFSMHSQSRVIERDGPPGADGPDPAAYLTDWRTSFRLAERACCCSAKPAIVVIMPPGPGRPAPSDLLLCRHHYLACERALAAVPAAVFDSSGVPLTPHTRSLVRGGC